MPQNTFDDKSTLAQQAISCANVDPTLCWHMVSLGHNELMYKMLVYENMYLYKYINGLVQDSGISSVDTHWRYHSVAF